MAVENRGQRVVRLESEAGRLPGHVPTKDFTLERFGSRLRGNLVFEGSGSGHGVGLCQWCARGRAVRGEPAERILGHFYPGTAIEKLY